MTPANDPFSKTLQLLTNVKHTNTLILRKLTKLIEDKKEQPIKEPPHFVKRPLDR